jgi:hypothetical protein
MTDAEDYLSAVEGDDPTIAAAQVMDRLAETLKAADGSATALAELKAAGEALADLAREADRPAAVVETARNEAGDVAQKANRSKDSIIDRIEKETDKVLMDEAADELRLDRMYGLDRYLEHDLERVNIIRSTDKVNDTILRWEFADGAVIEHDDSVHMHRYEFWEQLTLETSKSLSPDLASEQAGEPGEKEDRYRKLSLGPESRPWHYEREFWVESITDLMEERGTETERVGPRTAVWEKVQDYIRRSRMVADRADAVVESQPHAVRDGDGELSELWIPSSTVGEICEEWGLTPNALQSELAARGVDSDTVPGDGISDVFSEDGRATRYWRLDATHEEVPEPDEVVDELDDGLDRDTAGHGFEYGGEDE